MKPAKAFILMMKGHPVSEEYAATCAKSCEENDTPWEYIEWYDGTKKQNDAMKAWEEIPIEIKNRQNFTPRRNTAQCATSGHAMAWVKVRDLGKPAIIFEHDALLLHKIDIDIPEGQIVALGYKLHKPQECNHKQAGPPTDVIDVNGGGHEGAHAYAITSSTAIQLLAELTERGIPGAIDNTHFLKSRTKHTKVPIKIMNPTPAVGWLRESTIWNKAASKNYEFIESFKQNYTKA